MTDTTMTYSLEAIILPAADVDRAKEFYVGAGFALDVDHRAGDSFRVVQLTPAGSACSIMVGVGLTDGEPGVVKGLHLVVTDVEAAYRQLADRGVPVTNLRHMSASGWVEGVDPEHADYNSFAEFADPDGNVWILQERGYAGRS